MIDPGRLLAAVDREGFVVFPAPRGVARAAEDPWGVASGLLGRLPTMIERQPIRAVEGGRSFASSARFTPLHSDSQLFRGCPPRWQVLFCVESSSEGGETHLLDTWALQRALRVDDPALQRLLWSEQRRIPFVFGDVLGPTLALVGRSLVFTHSPIPPGDDPLARRILDVLARRTPRRVPVRRGEVLVVDNHRMLHGRASFTDPRRHLERILMWHELGAPPPVELLAGSSPHELHRAPPSHHVPTDEGIVLEMLRGTPPGVLAIRHRLPEPSLYEMRDQLLASDDARLHMLVRAGIRTEHPQ